MELKDRNNQAVLPNTTAANVSYGSTTVAAKIAELEQGGGGSAPVQQEGNLFDPATIVSGKGIVGGMGGAINTNANYSCVFVPLQYGCYYRLSGYLSIPAGGTNIANGIALAKGDASSFSNLAISELVSGCDWLEEDEVFLHQNNIYNMPTPDFAIFKTPELSEMVSPAPQQIGIVINVTYNGVTPANETLVVEHIPYDASSIRLKRVGFFGDSIVQGTNGGFVGKLKMKVPLMVAKNYGSSGSTSARLAGIMLGENFRNDSSAVNYSEKDYSQYDAVVIQIGTNAETLGNIDADIPDMSVDGISSYPYAYSASGKTVESATVNNAKEFFTKCFANTYYGNVALCIEYVRYINPNCRIFLTTIPPNIGHANFGNVREAICALAVKMGVQVIDAGAYAGLGRWNISYWSYDNTHFKAEGNEMWAAYIANELEKKFYETELS